MVGGVGLGTPNKCYPVYPTSSPHLNLTRPHPLLLQPTPIDTSTLRCLTIMLAIKHRYSVLFEDNMSTPRKYTVSAMQSAMQQVKEGSVSLHGSSRKYGIPLTSIHDRITGNVVDCPKWGKPTKLSRDDLDR